MYRSITLSEIVSSTFTNINEVNSSQRRKDKFASKLGVGLIEFLVSSLYQCYGIILAEYIELGEYPLKKALWTTFIYLAAWHITAPWSKFMIYQLEQRGRFYYKTVIILSTFLLAVGIVIPPHFLCYGIFGGTFTSIIYTHLKHLVRSKFKSTEKVFEGNIQAARAISLLIMPHILLLLIDNYSVNIVILISSAIVLNVIPATLILRQPKEDPDSTRGLTRYNTLPAFSQQMREMKVFATSDNTSDIKHGELFSADDYSSEDNKSESEEEEERSEETDDLIIQEENMVAAEHPVDIYLPPAPLTPTTVQLYYSHAGVSILPRIPEEEIEETEERNINVIDPKRLSRISTALEEINRINNTVEETIKEERKNSTKELVVPTEVVIKPDPIQHIEYIPNYTNRKNKFFKDTKFIQKKPCCSCSPYNLFLWKRRIRRGKDFLSDLFLSPLYRSLTDLHFYPIVVSKVTLMVSSNFFISLAPYITLIKNDVYRKEDMAFLLSYVAFAWCLSLVLLPLLIKFSAAKLRATLVIGLILSSFSMLLLTKGEMSNEFITWSTLLFGFGYGLTKFSEPLIYTLFAGKRRYAQMEAFLNSASGLLVILIYYFIYINNLDLVALFPIASAICYLVNAIIWIVVPILKEIIVFVRTYFRKRSDSGTIL